MGDPGQWSPWALGGGLLLAGALIVWAGVRLAGIADSLAEATGLGEAVSGAVLLGAATSLPGLVTSIAAAADNYPQLAVSNCIGSIAVQTAFLAVADFACRRGNLEHISASLPNLLQCGLLVALLSIALIGHALPAVAYWGVSPVSLVLVGVYAYGLSIARETQIRPMWTPRDTDITQPPEAASYQGEHSMRGLWLRYAGFGVLVGAGGWLVAFCGIGLVETMGWSQGVVGSLITAVASSLPELITSVAAVRHGAYSLAVGGIIGGNALDTLFLAASDFAYRGGSIYHAMERSQMLWMMLAILMTAVLLMGLVRREKRGPANVGSESIAILVLYAMGTAVLFLGDTV